MIHADVKWSTCIMIKILNLKFNIAEVSKHKNIFAKGYVPKWSEDVFVIKKVKTLCRGLTLLVILEAMKLLEHFTEKNWKNKWKRV